MKLKLMVIAVLCLMPKILYSAAASAAANAGRAENININNERLEEFILKVWTAYINNVSQAINTQGVGHIKEGHQFYLPILAATLDAIEFKGVIEVTTADQLKQLKELIRKILTDASVYLFKKETSDTTISLLERRLRIIVHLDEIGKLSTSDITRKIFFNGISLLNKAIDDFIAQKEVSLESLYQFQDQVLFIIVNLLPLVPRDDEKAVMIGGLFGPIITMLNDITPTIHKYFHAISFPASGAMYQQYLKDLQQAIIFVQKKWKTNDKIAADFVDRLDRASALLFAQPGSLVWCDCRSAFFEKRIALIIQLFYDVQKKYPNMRQRLVYTSLAAGGLLQDALTIRALEWRGYKNIDINLVDSDYRDIHMIEQLLDDPVSEDLREHLESRLNVLLNKAVINRAFEREVGVDFVWKPQFFNKKHAVLDSGIYATYYDNVYDYLKLVRQWPLLRSHVLVMVDPGRGIQIVDQSNQANIMVITLGEAPSETEEETTGDFPHDLASEAPFLKNMNLLLVIPYAGIEMYSNINISILLSEDQLSIRKVIDGIIHKTNAQTTHVPTIVRMLQDALTKLKAQTHWISDIYVGYFDCVVSALADINKSVLYQLEVDVIDIDPRHYYARKNLLGPKLSKDLQEAGYRKVA